MTPLRVGDLLMGHCHGVFDDADNYPDSRRVEAVGADWVVARNNHGVPCFAQTDPDDLTEFRA